MSTWIDPYHDERVKLLRLENDLKAYHVKLEICLTRESHYFAWKVVNHDRLS